jgi:hypothetical protein
MAPVAGHPFFLFAPWPPRWVRYDIVTNCAAYVPFGFSSASSRAGARLPSARDRRRRRRVLSFAMETLQMYVPARDASVADLLANTAGAALGGGFAALRALAAGTPGLPRPATAGSCRHAGDLGLALLAIWLAVQANPGIPLFATMYDSAASPFAGAGRRRRRRTLVECAHSAFQLLGVGLFVALLMRERRHVAGAVLLLIGAAAIVKGWRPRDAQPRRVGALADARRALGVLVGSLVLALAIRLPRSAQVTLAAIALLSSLLATLFAPDLLFARAPVRLFNGPYGHLLNFNGLTHTVLLLWPASPARSCSRWRTSRLGRAGLIRDRVFATRGPRQRALDARDDRRSGNCRRQSEKLATCWSQPSRMQGTHAPAPCTSSTLPIVGCPPTPGRRAPVERDTATAPISRDWRTVQRDRRDAERRCHVRRHRYPARRKGAPRRRRSRLREAHPPREIDRARRELRSDGRRELDFTRFAATGQHRRDAALMQPPRQPWPSLDVHIL